MAAKPDPLTLPGPSPDGRPILIDYDPWNRTWSARHNGRTLTENDTATELLTHLTTYTERAVPPRFRDAMTGHATATTTWSDTVHRRPQFVVVHSSGLIIQGLARPGQPIADAIDTHLGRARAERATGTGAGADDPTRTRVWTSLGARTINPFATKVARALGHPPTTFKGPIAFTAAPTKLDTDHAAPLDPQVLALLGELGETHLLNAAPKTTLAAIRDTHIDSFMLHQALRHASTAAEHTRARWTPRTTEAFLAQTRAAFLTGTDINPSTATERAQRFANTHLTPAGPRNPNPNTTHELTDDGLDAVRTGHTTGRGGSSGGGGDRGGSSGRGTPTTPATPTRTTPTPTPAIAPTPTPTTTADVTPTTTDTGPAL